MTSPQLESGKSKKETTYLRLWANLVPDDPADGVWCAWPLVPAWVDALPVAAGSVVRAIIVHRTTERNRGRFDRGS